MITIRKAVPEDLNTIVNFNISMAKETENKILDYDTVIKGVKFLLHNDKYGIYYIAEDVDSDTIIGQVMYTYEWSDWRNGLFLWIQSVYVEPSHRGQGIFTSLYSRIKSICDSSTDICGIRLYAEHNNDKAKQTYLKLGLNNSHYDMFEYEK